jgi:hypothetical protein
MAAAQLTYSHRLSVEVGLSSLWGSLQTQLDDLLVKFLLPQ